MICSNRVNSSLYHAAFLNEQRSIRGVSQPPPGDLASVAYHSPLSIHSVICVVLCEQDTKLVAGRSNVLNF